MEYPMAEDKYITIRILRADYDRIKVRAVNNHRSFPGEISFLLEIIENFELGSMNVIEISHLPGPEGAERPLLVTVKE
jgi:hypothetical protein